MPKGKKVLSYASAQAVCRVIYRVAPDASPDLVTAIFQQVYGVVPTMSEVMEARREVLEIAQAPSTLKQEYVVARLTLRPDMALATLDGDTLMLFGEVTRQETYERCRQMAKGMTDCDAARATIARCEQRVASRPSGFDLVDA